MTTENGFLVAGAGWNSERRLEPRAAGEAGSASHVGSAASFTNPPVSRPYSAAAAAAAAMAPADVPPICRRWWVVASRHTARG
jgi:hypothetical protein